jgi:hypothetical protein
VYDFYVFRLYERDCFTVDGLRYGNHSRGKVVDNPVDVTDGDIVMKGRVVLKNLVEVPEVGGLTHPRSHSPFKDNSGVGVYEIDALTFNEMAYLSYPQMEFGEKTLEVGAVKQGRPHDPPLQGEDYGLDAELI